MSQFVWVISKPCVGFRGTLYMRKHFRRCGKKQKLAPASPFFEDLALFKTKDEATGFLCRKWQKHHDLDIKWKPQRRKWGPLK